MKLFYNQWGLGPQKVGFLHGLGGTSSIWRPIASNLESKYKIIAFDQRGHGKSRAFLSNHFTPLDYAKDLVETIEIDRLNPICLVGHSMGARTAIASAFHRPDLFNKLVLVDIGFDSQSGGGIGESLFSFLKILPTSFATRMDARNFLIANAPDPSIASYLFAVSELNKDSGMIEFPFDHKSLMLTIEQSKNQPYRKWLEAILDQGIEILALRGQKSTVWTEEKFEEDKYYFESKFGPNQFTFESVPNAGHGLPFEVRNYFTGRIEDFIESKRKFF